MRLFLRKIRRLWLFNFFSRVIYATTYFNKKYLQILKWGFKSKEYTNYTYELTEGNIANLAHIVSVVTNEDYKKTLGYINEARNDDKLKSYIIEQTQKSKMKKFADLRCDFGRRLGWYAFVRIMKPKIVVETGVDKGLGSVLLCSALLKNKDDGFTGEYFGTDINPDAGYLLAEEYSSVGKILYGDSIKSLEKMNNAIDLFINDSDHSAEYEYQEYKTIKNLLNDKSVILGDNAHCTDMLSKFCTENSLKYLFFQEIPKNHWYPGAGIGIAYK
ncbi:MAG: class I SAM-dependent methyltransferase [Ignavibacteriae bacterium]|nr:class I SAM-dependent methyltransferase [Ignavibacteriota bacterium]NOG98097.1 class I SAM-dependent methyltransferase [Ignavibacteriota bacterium]